MAEPVIDKSDSKSPLTPSNELADLIKELRIDPKLLDKKKEQTTKKIEYVKNYVENWLYVWSNQSDTKTISFIDAMANAGIYQDGDLGTAVEVYILFHSFAEEHPSIRYRLYINDIQKERIDICLAVIQRLAKPSLPNLEIIRAAKDVNTFLSEAARTNRIPRGFGNAVLLFVDPYDARTVHLDSIRAFIESRYCEVLFNWFSNDYARNKNSSNYEAIRDCFDGLEIAEDTDATTAISNALRVGNIRYVFSYPFRIATNVELYQIIFLTPNSKGLEKLKDALWKTFNGAEYHRNADGHQIGTQISMFDLKEGSDLRAEMYSDNAKQALLAAFKGRKNVPYDEVSAFLMERTMLKDSQIIKYVIRPLSKSGSIVKSTTASPNAYKAATYSFK